MELYTITGVLLWFENNDKFCNLVQRGERNTNSPEIVAIINFWHQFTIFLSLPLHSCINNLIDIHVQTLYHDLYWSKYLTAKNIMNPASGT